MKHFFALLGLLFSVMFSQAQDSSQYFTEKPIQLKTTDCTIYGNLMMPAGVTKPPVVLIIAGSGPTDRNGNNKLGVSVNTYKKIATELALHKIASVRFDKRAIGESVVKDFREENLVFDDYVNDAKAWVSLLKEMNAFSTVIIAGHSEGSMIGMLAIGNADKFISLAGPAQAIDVVLKKQLEAMPEQLRTVLYTKLDSLKNGHLLKDVSPLFYSLMRPSVQPYLISWFKYTPAEVFSKLNKPALILQGDEDAQVAPEEAKLLSAANKSAELHILEHMDHLLCRTVYEILSDKSEQEFKDKKGVLHPELVPYMVKFINAKAPIK